MSANHLSRVTPLILILGLLTGCGGPPEKKYIPQADLARGALKAALEHWKSGAKHGPVGDFKVPVDVFDARWQNGKKLESYEILSEVPSDGPKIFLVKMKLDEDKAENEIKYFVVGKDPLLVFREQDYNKASGTGG
ncbi:MAG: hypothetical protein WCH39_25855 [Schlesneria sp.]